MTEEKRVRVCGKHDTEFNEHGRCVDCCAEDHMCEVCGEHTDLNTETDSFVCESCVVCAWCGCNDTDEIKKSWDSEAHSSEYGEAICESCHKETEKDCKDCNQAK